MRNVSIQILFWSLIILKFAGTRVSAQTTSAMQRYVDAYPMLKYDDVMQKAADELSKAEASKGKIDLSGIIRPLDITKNRIANFKVVARTTDTTKSDNMKIRLDLVFDAGLNPISLTFDVPTKGVSFMSVNTLIDSLDSTIAEKTVDFLCDGKQDAKANYIFALFNNYVFDIKSNDIPDKKMTIRNLKNYLNRKIQVYVEDELKRQGIDGSIITENILGILKDSARLDEVVLSRFNTSLKSLKRPLIDVIDKIIFDLQNIEKSAPILVGANAGVSVTNQESGVGGGFSATYSGDWHNKDSTSGVHYSVTVVVNGIAPVNSTDDVTSQPVTGGFLFKLANYKKTFQLNVITATEFNSLKMGKPKDNANSNLIWEAGLGIDWIVGTNLIMGLNGIYKFSESTFLLDSGKTFEKSNAFSLCLSFQSKSGNSPICLLGIAGPSGSHGNLTPTFQIVYPLKFNK